jgi:octaprenyl-diphosphate synthase
MASGRIGQALAANEIHQLVRKDLKRVEEAIRRESIASVDAITAIGSYLQESGGKRIRPTLLLLSCRLFHDPSEAAIDLAAVVEMIHTATLVHDDVIDVAETRRGRPSTNALWGNHTSVLAGDWIYMQAFQVALRQRNFHILDTLISLTQLMVEGELLQFERLGRIDISEADYMELVDRKTASLFSACARLGAHAGGAEEAVESRLAEFGWNLGMAFQLVDDVLDFTSREKVLGKPIGNDLQEGKVTLPLIYALAEATPADRKLVELVLDERSYRTVPFGSILEVVERNGGVGRAMERAQSFTDRARQIITEFPQSPVQRALAAVPDLITDRDH